MNFNKNWKFILEDLTSGHLLDLNEEAFSIVDLPHDYSIEQPYNHEAGEGCTGYLLGGIAWYRKTFKTTEDMREGKVFICFDGIYNRSNIYVNETFVAFHPYGYSPILLDITPYLHREENVIAVQVDHTRYADSRWYTGSGIYRNVELHVLPKTYMPLWGMKLKTENVTEVEATISMALEVKNETDRKEIQVKTNIYAPNGEKVVENEQTLGLTEQTLWTQEFTIKNPVLWDIYEGNMYTVQTSLIDNGTSIQVKEEKIGIRTFSFESNEGFFLNGRNELIKGVCLHHDAGLVGAAVPKDVWRRRLQILMEGGCNAIRTAHNPASKEFLDLCDEMGLLVQEEFYDEWDYPKDKRFNMKEQKVDYITRGHHEFFQEYAKSDLQAVVNRDFNHPCIIQWSIGNEIEWTYPKYVMATGYFDASASGNYFWEEPPYTPEQIRGNVKKLPRERYEVGETAAKLSKWTKEIDESRPIVANCILPSASYESGYTDALDIVGFSYRQVVYERSHKHYPDKPILGTENLAQWHEWKQVLEKAYLAGIFLWTGIDYIGESGNEDLWPRKAMPSGLLDVAGFKKPPYYMFQSLWSDKPCLYMVTQTLENSLYCLDEDQNLVEKEGADWRKRLWYWQPVNEHWNYTCGEEVVVELYSNCDSVTLYVNDKEVSTLYLTDFEDRIYKWHVAYLTGRVTAIGNKDGQEIITTLMTATEPVNVVLCPDKSIISVENQEVVHLEATLIDETGNAVRNKDIEIEFKIEGNAKLYGVDNGSPNFVGNHRARCIQTNKGRALLVVGGYECGEIEVIAIVKGKLCDKVRISVTK